VTTPKYHAQPCVIDGIRFASKLEGRRYQQLKVMEQAGEIFDLMRQNKYSLHAPNGTVIGYYVADFVYMRGDKIIIEDAKGVLTPLCRWKIKHMAAQGDTVTLWPPRKTKSRKAKK
jgi:hypothetical protein